MNGLPLLWDVDTQIDFVYADGKLPVPDAESAMVAMAQLVAWAKVNGITHLATVDDHELTDPEISDEPDFVKTFPPHCLRGTHGAAKLAATVQVDPMPFSLTVRIPVGELPRELLILKKDFDAFTNPNLDLLLTMLDPSEVILFGVATDICCHASVKGILNRGYKVAFVTDASAGIDEEQTAEVQDQWRKRGVRFTTSTEVINATQKENT